MLVRIWFRDWVISFYVFTKNFKNYLTFRTIYFQKRSITQYRHLLKPKKGIYRATTLRDSLKKVPELNEIFALTPCQAQFCWTVCRLYTVGSWDGSEMLWGHNNQMNKLLCTRENASFERQISSVKMILHDLAQPMMNCLSILVDFEIIILEL